MPQKEHLTFESKTPSFLRRLRGETSTDPNGQPRDPDRHATPQVRAKRPRAPEDEDEGPVVVDGVTGIEVGVKDGEVGEDSGAGAGLDVDSDGEILDSEESRAFRREILAKLGASRKRKGGPKVVAAGEDDDGGGDGDGGDGVSGGAAKRKAATRSKADAHADPDADKGRSTEKTKVKKKGKKVKLSFDDET